MKRLTIGLCTVSTRPHNYLLTTLDSIISQSDDEDKKDFQVVVFDCDLLSEDSPYIREVKERFKSQIEEGLIQIVKTSAKDYPDLTNLTPTLGDSPKRVYWRSKQSLDYGLIMAYCAGLSEYYLHLEDDVICAPDFYNKIMADLHHLQDKKWCAIQFSDLGFIGLLFHDRDLKKLATFLRGFFDEMPVDWLFEYYVALQKRAGRALIKRPKSLFQHIGFSSSLKGKRQAIESSSFDSFVPDSALRRGSLFLLFSRFLYVLNRYLLWPLGRWVTTNGKLVG